MPLSNSFKNGKSSSLYLPPPPPPQPPSHSKSQESSVVDAIKLPVDDFTSLPPPPPPIAFDVKNSPPPAFQQNPYKPGLATEMLEKSLRNLQVSEKDEFRTNAGKIISLMLESRLNDKDAAGDVTPNRPFDDSAITMLPNGKSIVQINGGKAAKQNGNGTIQMIVPETVLSQTMANQNDHNSKFLVSVTLPTVAPPPPPPPTPQFNSVPPSFEQHTTRNGNAIASEHCNVKKVEANGGGDHTNNGGVVFRNRESKLTTHARDRRSYIEKDSNINNNNNNKGIDYGNVVSTNKSTPSSTVMMAAETTDKVSELVDGKQPVCNCCNMKITR